jgi:imidazolonepropionase-like amidohydrolase
MNVSTPSNERRIWLRVGALLDGVSTTPLRNAHLVYDQNQIVFVGQDSPPRHLLGAEQRAPDLDLPDCILLPGLIDAHTHLFLEGGELDTRKRAAHLKQTPDHLLESACVRLEKLVRLGVAAIRDAGDKNGVGLALSQLYAKADRPVMPYVDSPGAAIHRRGRYGTFMAQPMEDYSSPRSCVASRIHAGARRIKLIATGVVNFKKGAVTAEPQMTSQEIGEFVSATASFGKQTFAHASGDDGIERVIQGGVDSIEHGFFVRDDQLLKMCDQQIAWVPTFSPLQKQIDHAEQIGWDAQTVDNLNRILDQHALSLLHAREIGVHVIAGSDAGSYGVQHGIGLFDELELMERAGLPPVAVINSATGAGSKRLAFGEKFGQIMPGFLPRFILTRHSPLQGITNLRKPRTVIFGDKCFATDENLDSSGL